jgi:hypothetical protein
MAVAVPPALDKATTNRYTTYMAKRGPKPITKQPITKICKQCKQKLDISCFNTYKNRGKQLNTNNIPYTLNVCKRCRHKQKLIYADNHLEYKHREKVNGIRHLREWKNENRGTIAGFIYSNLNHWRKRDPNCDLTNEYLINLWNKQNGKCFYTGIQLILSPGTSRKNLTKNWYKINSVSLDKQDPSLGYKQGNVVWCSFRINSMKYNYTTKQFIDLCKYISTYSNNPQVVSDLPDLISSLPECSNIVPRE